MWITKNITLYFDRPVNNDMITTFKVIIYPSHSIVNFSVYVTITFRFIIAIQFNYYIHFIKYKRYALDGVSRIYSLYKNHMSFD